MIEFNIASVSNRLRFTRIHTCYARKRNDHFERLGSREYKLFCLILWVIIIFFSLPLFPVFMNQSQSILIDSLNKIEQLDLVLVFSKIE